VHSDPAASGQQTAPTLRDMKHGVCQGAKPLPPQPERHRLLAREPEASAGAAQPSPMTRLLEPQTIGQKHPDWPGEHLLKLGQRRGFARPQQ